MTSKVLAWEQLRASLLSRLERDILAGLVDNDMVDLLLHLNSYTCIATSSSCSGRIAVIAAPLPGDKKEGGVVAKWHRKVEVEELAKALKKALARHPRGFVWVSAQPALLTLYVNGLQVVNAILQAAEAAGFKYSCAKPRSSVGAEVFYVIVIGTERIDVPVAFRGRRIVEEQRVDVLAEMLNTYLSLAKSKLERLKRSLAAVNLDALCPRDEATLHGIAVKKSDLSEGTSLKAGQL